METKLNVKINENEYVSPDVEEIRFTGEGLVCKSLTFDADTEGGF